MWTSIASFFAGDVFKYILIGVLVVAVGFLWFDYQNAKKLAAVYQERSESYEADLKSMEADIANERRRSTEREQTLRDDLKKSAESSKSREEKNRILQSKIDQLRKLKRSKNETPRPLPPAILGAFDILRGNGTEDSHSQTN